MTKKNPAAVALGRLGGARQRDHETNSRLGRKGARSLWASLSVEEKAARIAKMHAGRRAAAARRRAANARKSRTCAT